ncbi:MAG: hypothetical protein ACQKBT_01700 [Puniceicoccales bacterium]
MPLCSAFSQINSLASAKSLHYASLVSESIWSTLKACRKAGVELIFIGPPPSRLWDSGELIDDEFSRWVGVRRIDAEEYDAVLRSQRPVPGLTDWEPDRADFSPPISAEPGTHCLTDAEGKTIGVRLENVTWLSTLDPRENFYQQIPALESGSRDLCHYGKGFYRWYIGKDSGSAVLVCIAPYTEFCTNPSRENRAGFVLKEENGQWCRSKGTKATSC